MASQLRAPRAVKVKQPKPVKIPEKAVMVEIRTMLKYQGWVVIRIQQGLGCMKGISDYIACKRGLTIWIECKASDGVQSPYQVEFQRRIEAVGGHYVCAKGYADVEAAIQRITGQTEKERLF
jgi:hypothetical protein